MASLNLRGEPPGSEEPRETLPDEPLGLDLIRRWLQKPRPRLHALWLWGPYLAEGIRNGYGWLRKNSGPALRRTAETLRKAARVTQALREAAGRLSARLEKTFPPGSKGRAVAGQLAKGSRLLLGAALTLVGIGQEAERFSVYGREPGARERRSRPKRPPSGNGPKPAPETRGGPEPDEPRASTGADPAGGKEPATSPVPSGSPGSEVPREAPPQREPSPPTPPPPEPPPPEPSREDPPAGASAGSAPDSASPAPDVPPGPRADALAKLSRDLRSHILMLGKRPRKAELRYTIWRILKECGAQTSKDLGLLLGMDPANLAKRHVSPLIDHGVVERTIPDRINHPEQAYRATGPPPGADGLPPIRE